MDSNSWMDILFSSAFAAPYKDCLNKMPLVNFDLDKDLEEWDWSTVATGMETIPIEVPSEEFWSKFEELPDLGEDLETLFAEATGIDDSIAPTTTANSLDVLRNHDCMWAGVCHSKDHTHSSWSRTATDRPVAKQSSPSTISAVPTPPQTIQAHGSKVSPTTPPRDRKRTVVVQKSRSLLLPNRPVTKPVAKPLLARPDTPQSLSESEEETSVVVSVAEVTGQVRRKCPNLSVQFDHNYDTKKAVVRADQLGVQTPSDSEAERSPSEEDEEEFEEQEGEEDEEEEYEEVEEEGEMVEEEYEEQEEEDCIEEEYEEQEEEEEEEEEDDEDEEIDVVSLTNTRTHSLTMDTRPVNMHSLQRSGRTSHQSRTVRVANSQHNYSQAYPRNANTTLPTNPSQQMNMLQESFATAITTNTLLTASKAVSKRLHTSIKRKRCSPSPDGSPDRVSSGRGRKRGHYTPNGSKKTRFSSSDNALVDTEKRSLHNNMERMRRIDLRNAFEDLRTLVPTIAESQKAAKVTILRDSTHYVKEMNLKDRNLSVQLVALRREQDRLRRTLSHLRRFVAFKNTASV